MRLLAVGLSALLLGASGSDHQPQTAAIHTESQAQFGAADLARLEEFLQETVEPAAIQHSEGADEFAPKEFELRHSGCWCYKWLINICILWIASSPIGNVYRYSFE